MKKYNEPLLPDTFYHIFNRSVGNEVIFREEKNYPFFLNKYGQFLNPVVDTYAYALLGNHFHLAIRTKSIKEILSFKPESLIMFDNELKATSWTLGNQFASFFRSYTNSINQTYGRTGGLFEERFRRKKVETDEYLSRLIYYIHTNPQRHGFCTDYRDYPYSSYHSHLSTGAAKLKRDNVIRLFGSAHNYKVFHATHHDLRIISDLIIDL